MQILQVSTDDMTYLLKTIFMMNFAFLVATPLLIYIVKDLLSSFIARQVRKADKYKYHSLKEIENIQFQLDMLKDHLTHGQPDQRGTLAALDGLAGHEEK